MQTDAQTAVIEELREVTVFPDWIRGEATEVYYDARVSGDDLWDLITRLAERFDVDFTGLNIRQYAPGEGAETIRPLLMLLGRRPYRSLTVGKLATAIQRGRWRDD